MQMVLRLKCKLALLFLCLLLRESTPFSQQKSARSCSFRIAKFSNSDSFVTRKSSNRDDDTITEAAESEGKGIAKDNAIRQRLLAESIAPWRNLRLFVYFSGASGAGVGGLITLTGVLAALSGARPDLDLDVEYLNLAIDFGFVFAFAIAAKLDLDGGKELQEGVDAKIQKKKDAKVVKKRMKEREEVLADLSVSIRVTDDGAVTTAKVGELQKGARQHMIFVIGPKPAIRDALLGASLMKMEKFALSNVLIVPYDIDRGLRKTDVEQKPSGGFGDTPRWESKAYVAQPEGVGWDSYAEDEMKDAIEQSGKRVKNEGIVLVVSNEGKVIRRGVGTVPWKQMVAELTGVTD